MKTALFVTALALAAIALGIGGLVVRERQQQATFDAQQAKCRADIAAHEDPAFYVDPAAWCAP